MQAASYSDRSIVIYGDTKPYRKTLSAIGASYNPNLAGGPGWIIPSSKRSSVLTLPGIDHIKSERTVLSIVPPINPVVLDQSSTVVQPATSSTTFTFQPATSSTVVKPSSGIQITFQPQVAAASSSTVVQPMIGSSSSTSASLPQTGPVHYKRIYGIYDGKREPLTEEDYKRVGGRKVVERIHQIIATGGANRILFGYDKLDRLHVFHTVGGSYKEGNYTYINAEDLNGRTYKANAPTEVRLRYARYSKSRPYEGKRDTWVTNRYTFGPFELHSLSADKLFSEVVRLPFKNGERALTPTLSLLLETGYDLSGVTLRGEDIEIKRNDGIYNALPSDIQSKLRIHGAASAWFRYNLKTKDVRREGDRYIFDVDLKSIIENTGILDDWNNWYETYSDPLPPFPTTVIHDGIIDKVLDPPPVPVGNLVSMMWKVKEILYGRSLLG